MEVSMEARRKPEIDIGIVPKQRAQLAESLSVLLADSYTLSLQTQNFHWNVEGPMFRTLHLMFEEEYTQLALAVDGIAERIRALGVAAPATYGEFSRRTSIRETEGVPEAEEMIRILLEGHETAIRTARKGLPLAEKAHDAPTADLLTARMEEHEKTAWMLRSMLAG
jgi:starvation-inducible DNA-binding protein